MRTREHTKSLFVRPLIFQEGITYLVLAPLVTFLCLKVSEGFRENFLEGLLYIVSFQMVISLPLGAWVKYHFVRPVIELMEEEKQDPKDLHYALRSASILPFVESATIFIRWSIMVWCSVALPLYLRSHITFADLIFAGSILCMTGLSATAFYFLASENSLSSFYEGCSMKGALNDEARCVRISLNKKLFIIILAISIPPIGYLISTIYLSIYTGIRLETLQLGFFLILTQTVITTLLNSFLLMKKLTHSVGSMSLMLKDMAKGKGDLTKRLKVTGIDEVGELARWFNEFVEDLQEIIGRMRETSLQLHQAIEEVSSGSQGLSQATQEQSSSVEQISASIEEMNATIKNNADLIREGKDTSQAITKLIDRNKEVFSQLMKAIDEISHDSRKIGDIVVTVNEVAFQTNLLALNAAVEAARAGEHGKGFAVVAKEVRALAQRSADAAKEIHDLIDMTVGRIKTGDEMMKKTSDSLEEIMSRLEFFFGMMDVINAASIEQTQNISELSQAITQIDSSTQHNASTVEELAGTLDNLRIEATVLAKNVKQFKTSRE